MFIIVKVTNISGKEQPYTFHVLRAIDDEPTQAELEVLRKIVQEQIDSGELKI